MSDDCVHCSSPDCDGAVCARCPCLHCVTRRDTPDNPDSDAWCLPCVRWIGQLGTNIRGTIAQIARDKGTTLAQARADLLAAYHHHHTHTRSTDD